MLIFGVLAALVAGACSGGAGGGSGGGATTITLAAKSAIAVARAIDERFIGFLLGKRLSGTRGELKSCSRQKGGAQASTAARHDFLTR